MKAPEGGASTGSDMAAMAQEVIGKMDMGALASTVQVFADTFKAMQSDLEVVKGLLLLPDGRNRLDVLLHNQKLSYDLLMRTHQDLLAGNPGMGLPRVQEAMRRTRK